MSKQVTVRDAGFILGVPASEMQGPGTYIIEDGHVIGFVPFGLQSITVSDAATTTIVVTGNDASSETISETVYSDTPQVQVNNGG